MKGQVVMPMIPPSIPSGTSRRRRFREVTKKKKKNISKSNMRGKKR